MSAATYPPTHGLSGRPVDPADAGPVRVILVEDDHGDAFLVEELLAGARVAFELTWVQNLADATSALDSGVRCVLLDLNLPDATGMEGLTKVLELAPQAAVIVLTGLADEHRGVEAVAAGAEDYLVKGQVDGELLARAIRFAVERKRADSAALRLREAEMLASENARMERALLPTPLLHDDRVHFAHAYRPGRRMALLGGDFFDVIERDGSVFALIGDVSGHGPDEAALGVCLRIAWRTLVLSGVPADGMLPVLDMLVVRERHSPFAFATVCMVVISPDRGSADMYLAGHPSPILVSEPGLVAGGVGQLPMGPRGPALGFLPEGHWPAVPVPLPPSWALLLFTDGLFEARTGNGPDRLGEEGLVDLIARHHPGFPVGISWPETLLDAVEEQNGGALADDAALVVLSHAAEEEVR
ncbi:PP2C family protein-serine/threonine phosphatase [Cryptosporangium arvum]|uniref:Serine phosphatase RsbU, regulator of sigma subunit n=1 Tax=Cryptosporangium arvum DSM 44712 TaxID=927661 RepID=A0A010YGE8_9ACTN|nr:SpoIIE family protein phosphatase [Cryptosporangium arvum]EXG79305.1 serine phosphatase RsbU, regulator of sigma subunit [Cryptosporangium arvum DSM 44712]